MPANQHANPPAVIVKAFTWAYEELGWSRAQAAQLLSVSESMLVNSQWVGFEIDSLQNQVQLAFIRMYHLLYALSDGDTDEMQGWLKRYHSDLKTYPVSLCGSLGGLQQVIGYLESEQNEAMDNRATHVLPVSLSQWK